MSKKDLIARIENIKQGIKELKTITQIGETEGFELLIEKIKKDMIENVKEENWSKFKQNKAEIAQMRGFTDYIEKQTTIIEQKEEELEKLEYELDHYQAGLFEELDEPIGTGIVVNNKELRTGEVYKVGDTNFLLVTVSSEMADKFALVANFFEGERLLQYPANQDLLLEADYIGNAYYKGDTDAHKALTVIEEYLKNNSAALGNNAANNEVEKDQISRGYTSVPSFISRKEKEKRNVQKDFRTSREKQSSKVKREPRRIGRELRYFASEKLRKM